MIECTTLHGKKKMVEAEDLIMRPAAYGIVTHGNKILLINTKSTNKWFFPGGEIEKGEKIEEALRRELREETGIAVEAQRLFTVQESFFYYDPWDKAFQNISFIYICTPKTFLLSDSKNEKRDEAENPQWVEMNKLKPVDFQDWAGTVFQEYFTIV
ncbi:MAG: NUDIX domain-containing protein [bacterium]|nr:NUDIX domain-containing protein [bacterium]